MIDDGLSADLADDLTARAALGGIIGAKLYWIIEYSSFSDTIDGLSNIIQGMFTLNLGKFIEGIQFIGSGLVFYGGLIGGMIAITIYLVKNNYNWFFIADWVAPYLALGHSIGRIGCFLVGDDYGRTTTMWWGVAFPNGIPPTIDPVHPTQLFEMTIYFIIFLYLRNRRKHHTIAGSLMFKYLFLVGISRFSIEFIRVNDPVLFGYTGAQIVSLIMILSATIFLYINKISIKSN